MQILINQRSWILKRDSIHLNTELASFGNENYLRTLVSIYQRWVRSSYLWQSSMVDGMIDAATVILMLR
jgi:hypothetical protein